MVGEPVDQLDCTIHFDSAASLEALASIFAKVPDFEYVPKRFSAVVRTSAGEWDLQKNSDRGTARQRRQFPDGFLYFRDCLKTVGDCPDFAESSRQNGTVPLSATVLRQSLTHLLEFYPRPDVERKAAVEEAARMLQLLWSKGFPAVAACDYEDELLHQGGYRDASLPWPRAFFSVRSKS